MFTCQTTSHTRSGANVWPRWIAGKISEILGNEDDVVIELCFNLLEGTRYVRQRRIFQRAIADGATNSLISKYFKFSLPDFLTRTLPNSARSSGFCA